MATPFTARLATWLRADAHGLLDALEEPRLLLRQHLRDAELALEEKRARAAALADEEARLAESARRGAEALAGFDRDVERALAEGAEELARFAAARWIAARRELAQLDVQRGEARGQRERLEERLAAQEAELEALRARVRARTRGSDAAFEPGADATGVPAEEVELELLRRRREEGRT